MDSADLMCFVSYTANLVEAAYGDTGFQILVSFFAIYPMITVFSHVNGREFPEQNHSFVKTRISFWSREIEVKKGGSSLHINCIVLFPNKKIKKAYELGIVQERHVFPLPFSGAVPLKSRYYSLCDEMLWLVLDSKQSFHSLLGNLI